MTRGDIAGGGGDGDEAEDHFLALAIFGEIDGVWRGAKDRDAFGVERDLREDEITVLEGWAGDLYGIPVQSTLDAIRLSGSLEGMIIDPVYEGKSMAGLIDLVSSGEIPKDGNVLYAHLGGQPAINAYSALFRS